MSDAAMHEQTGSRLRRARMAFWAWRHSRPFWGGLWCILGGLIIAYGPLSALKVILIAGMIVWAGILVGVLVLLMGLFIWLTPQVRQVCGILAVVFSLVSLLSSDYGGFVIGMSLGIVGGALGFAWTPVRQQTP